MSNRDRIERLRAEADAAAQEKAAAKAAKAAQPAASRKSTRTSKKAAAPPRRVRLVWSVCGPSGAELKQFPYAQEAEARAEAQLQTTTTGRTHFVTQSEITVD